MPGFLGGVELFPVYQKIVKLDDQNKVFAHEALMRGQHESGRILSPAELFQDAEAKVAVQRLDFEARKIAIRDSVHLDTKGFLFLNCHTDSLHSGRIFDKEPVVPFERIVLEVTEQQQIRDVGGVISNIQKYRDLGMKIALDDFGAGYSNFFLVEALNPDFIKLDRLIIQPIEHSKLAIKVIEGLTAFAAKMSCKIIAEGIETEGQLKILQSLGVEYGQGFHLGLPQKIQKPKTMIH